MFNRPPVRSPRQDWPMTRSDPTRGPRKGWGRGGRDRPDWDRDPPPPGVRQVNRIHRATRPSREPRSRGPRGGDRPVGDGTIPGQDPPRAERSGARRIDKRAMAAFRAAANADGAGESGLARLTYAVMFNFAVDGAIAVALANTLFFAAASAESKTRVALYLLVTVAPFALIAPVIGPLLDRLQQGRRAAMAASFAGRVVMVLVMATNFDTWWLYPAALGEMVLSKSFIVLKGAVTPRVLPPGVTLVRTNSRLAVFGMASAGVFGLLSLGLTALLGSTGGLWFTAALALIGMILCLRIPSWVEITDGETPLSTRTAPAVSTGPAASAATSAPTAASGPRLINRPMTVALWGNGSIRVLTGFLMLFPAFVIKHATEHAPWRQAMLLGLIAAAAGVGTFLGNATGARIPTLKPDRIILGATGVAALIAVLGAIIDSLATVVVITLVAATASTLAKVCLDSVIARETAEESRASAFGRSETILQLGWVLGGALGVVLPPTLWIGFATIAGLLILGGTRMLMAEHGRSLLSRPTT